MAGDLNHLSPHVLFFFLPNLILLSFNLVYQNGEMIRWLLLHLKMCNLKMLASS